MVDTTLYAQTEMGRQTQERRDSPVADYFPSRSADNITGRTLDRYDSLVGRAGTRIPVAVGVTVEGLRRQADLGPHLRWTSSAAVAEAVPVPYIQIRRT